MALRTLWSRIDWPRKRESAGAFCETTATRSCTTLSAIDRGICMRLGVAQAAPGDGRHELARLLAPEQRCVTRSTLMISKVTSTIVRSSRSRSSSAESFWETSSSICELERLAGLAGGGAPPGAGPTGGSVPAGDARRHAAAHHELPDDLAAGGPASAAMAGRWTRGAGRAGVAQAEGHLAEGDGVLELEPAGRDPRAVDAGAVRAAEVLHLDAVGADDRARRDGGRWWDRRSRCRW